jgi:TonB family protein
LSTEVTSWHDELQLDHRRRLRNASFVSLALHVVVFAAFAISPPRSAPPLPAVLAVDLVAATPNAAPAARPARATKPRAVPAPAPEPAPEPVAPPPPPPPKAPVQVLPEEAPLRIKKLERKPAPEKTKTVAKVEPKPAPKPAPAAPKPEPPEELSYEDAMAALDDELGEDDTADLLAPAPPQARPSANAESSGRPGATRGAVASPELVAWSRATRRKIQGVWVTPPNFRGRGLITHLELRLSASGDVLEEPQVLRSSGDPYFDDNAVRAVLMASPLPPPPQPGTQSFLFRSEAD